MGLMRGLVPLLISVVIALGMAGCGGSTASGHSTLTIWYSTDDPVESSWSRGLVRLFERRHPHVAVQMRVYGLDDFNTKMQTALSAHVPPDLAYATPRAPGIPIYVGAHELMDLTSIARSKGWQSLLRPGLLAHYNDPFTLYRSQKAQSGNARTPIYGVPDAVAAVGLMYNRALLGRLHLGLPRSEGQLVADAAIAKRRGYIPFGLGNADGWLGDDWYLTLVNALYPPSYLGSELRLSRTFTFRRPGFFQASRTLDQWATQGYFTPQFGSLDAQSGIDSFFQGKTLFQLISSTEDAQIMKDQSTTHIPIGVTAFPAIGGRGVMPYSGYEGWIIPKATKNRTAAIEWIDFMLHPEAKRYLLRHGVLPAMPTAPSQGTTVWQRSYLSSLNTARPGVYIDAAPVPNLNATMEANVAILLQQVEPPSTLPDAMQQVYTSHGTSHNRVVAIDGEF
ncbi:MAG TPA: ABC transporter substrate-binding protein [Chloroflexota bacterium]|nr:ABC transporter substrate-binding protein [Chloroflexota bacterium]